MAVQYWIGDFFIDLSRNQISQHEQSQTIAPKALAVLTYLAQNQKKVVGFDVLLAHVWPNTVVTLNTLQRSIAQLRKAFGEDSKIQSYIKTHAKQGYSLECEVVWQDEDRREIKENLPSESILKTPQQATGVGEGAPVSEPVSTAGKTRRDVSITFAFSKPMLMLLVVTAVIMLGLFGLKYFAPKPVSPLSFETLRSVTASDHKEFDATYSLDGKYIIFHRYFDKRCINNIWAKNIATQKETQLTKDFGTYGRHSLSKDGKTLVFIESQDCRKPVSQNTCYNLMGLDLKQALSSPQSPRVLMQCKNSAIKNPIWLTSSSLAILQNSSGRWQLTRYSLNKNKSSVLYSLKGGNLVSFDYLASEEIIAVVSIHNDQKYYLDMLNPDGHLLSSHRIEYPKEIPKFRPLYPRFDPLNKQLIFSTGRQLFTLSYEGKVAKISLPLGDAVHSPQFHPNGKQLLLIKGRYDSDIALVPLALSTQSKPRSHTDLIKSEKTQDNVIVERSRLAEDYAIFQPGGELIAFMSRRSGEGQIWITDGNGAQQVSHFPMDTYINGVLWAADGKSLLVNANSGLTQVFLDSSQKPIALEHAVVRLFQWNSNANTALLTMRIKGIARLVELNLNNSAISVINDKAINWAQKSATGLLIYKDKMNRFWQPGPAEDKRIERLAGQGDPERFIMKDNVIYAINRDNQLWSYDLNQGIFKIIQDMHQDVDYLTDINQTHLLSTRRIFAKKEVVELLLSQ